MPTPETGESESDFIDRCTAELIEEEGRDSDQAVAMCHTFWNANQKNEVGTVAKTNEGPAERKVIPFIVTKVNEAQGIVEHTVAIMGNTDLGGDKIWPGAFTKTITERSGQIRVLDSHNTDSIMRVLGRPIEMREISHSQLPAKVLERYPEATGALVASTQFLMDTPEGRGAFSRIASGSIGEYSIGYDPISVDFETIKMDDGTEGTVRNLREIRLWEYSPVIFAMNPATSTIGAKGADENSDTTEENTADISESTGSDKVTETETDGKEMTPSGPQRRLGDVLQGSIHRTFTTITDQLYIDGYIDREQRIALSALIGSALDVLSVGIPIEIAEIPLPEWGYGIGYMASDNEQETKAGRVLAARNVTRIAGALATLLEVLEDAGIDIPGFGADDDEKADTPTEGPDVDKETEPPSAAGPGEGPPTATGDDQDDSAEPDGDPLTEPEGVMSVDEMDQWLMFINEQLEEISNEP